MTISLRKGKYEVIIIALFTIYVGLFFRFHNLEGKVYWLDESFTSLSVSAYSREDVKQHLITGQEIDFSVIKNYQYPHQETDYKGTIRGLIEDEPQHTPLYFLSARFWLQIFGHSIFTIRAFSVITGVFCLPLMYLLCMELFEQPSIAWLATTLMAVSPFHVLYSQEARPFSLWTLTTLLSCIALLKAQKEPSTKSWLFYSFSTILSLYTFLFSLLTCLAHFIYILTSEKFCFNKITIAFIMANLLAILGFSPWLKIIIKEPPSNYTSFPASSLIAYPKAWIRNLTLPFIDFNINSDSHLISLLLFSIYLLALLYFLTKSFNYLIARSRKKALLFLASLLIIPCSILIIHDFGKGGQMTMRANYLIPSLLSIQITFANLLGNKIRSQKGIWLSVTAAFLSLSIASCSMMTNSNIWWNKNSENIHHQLAEIINQSELPLIISDVLTDDEYIKPFSISHYLNEKAKFMFFFEPTENEGWQKIDLPNRYSEIFLYAPSESLKTYLVENYGYSLIPLFEQSDLYCDCPDRVFYKLASNKANS